MWGSVGQCDISMYGAVCMVQYAWCSMRGAVCVVQYVWCSMYGAVSTHSMHQSASSDITGCLLASYGCEIFASVDIIHDLVYQS